MVGLVVAFVLVEGVARAVLPQLAPRTARITRFWRYDPQYGWHHQPGTQGYFDSFGVRAFVTINADGYRGPIVAYARDRARSRVLVLGDSYVWGFGVSDHEVVTERLREALPDVEVVNLGVSGYSTDQELRLYQLEGYRYGADLVVILVTENDALGNLLAEQYVVYGKPVFQVRGQELEVVNVPVPRAHWLKRAAVQTASQSYVLTALNRYVYSETVNHVASARGGEEDTRHAGGTVRWLPGQELTMRLLVELRRQIAALQGRARLFVVFTEDVTFSQEMARYLRSFDIESLDLEAHIDPRDTRLHLPGDFHWNAEGHQRVAAVLAPSIRAAVRGEDTR
jgi:lysophospholipase L1-like esterase